MTNLKRTIMKRDNLTSLEADEQIQLAVEAFHDYLASDDSASAYGICEEYFALEPDFLEDLLSY